MHEEIAGPLLRVGDTELDALADHHAGVADLTAGFRVKRRLVENDGAGLAGLEAVSILAVFDERCDHALGGFGLIAEEFGRPEFLAQRKPDVLAGGITASRPRRARLLFLLFHRIGERREIDA